MKKTKRESIEDIIRGLDHCIEQIENWPDSRRPYANLYDLALASLEHLSEREDLKKGLLSRKILGILARQYLIYVYTSWGAGIVKVTPIKISDDVHTKTALAAFDFRMHRTYLVGGAFGIKSMYTEIQETDPVTSSIKIVHTNPFLNPFKM